MKRILQLTHIAGYLPYGLKVRLVFDERSEIPWYYERDNENHLFDLCGMMLDWYGKDRDITKIIPILRPISDLIKPCLPDGKIPLVELAKIAMKGSGYEIAGLEGEYCLAKSEIAAIYIKYSSALGLTKYYNSRTYPAGANIEVMDFIHQHHFDYRGLIEVGLAIDMNSILLDSDTRR